MTKHVSCLKIRAFYDSIVTLQEAKSREWFPIKPLQKICYLKKHISVQKRILKRVHKNLLALKNIKNGTKLITTITLSK